MSLGEETGVNIEDWTQRTIDSHSFTGAIKFCRRPQGGEPKWSMIVTDAGEVRVYDYLGIHQSDHDIALGFNPSNAFINNQDIPLIAVKDGTTIRVYKEGAELFNTGAITNLRHINISSGYLHCTVGGNVGAQWRSLTDGSVLYTRAITMDGNNIGEIWPTESGEIIFTQYRDTTGSRYGHTIKATTSALVWNRRSVITNGYPKNLRCSGDGSLIVFRENAAGDSRARVVDGNNNLLDDYVLTIDFVLACQAQPDGAYCAWARVGTTIARVVKSDGSVTNITLPDKIAPTEMATECVLGNYILFACIDGNIYVYEPDGTLKATISYGLGTTPIAAVIK